MNLATPLTDEEIAWVKSNYPDLNILSERRGITKIAGSLPVCAVITDDLPQLFIVDPDTEQQLKGIYINDSYDVEIVFDPNVGRLLPTVKELGVRIRVFAETHGLSLADVHLFEDETCCLILDVDVPLHFSEGFDIEYFFTNVLTRFFCGHSIFELNGTRPLGEYAHGAIGYLEWYLWLDVLTNEFGETLLNKLKMFSEIWPYLYILIYGEAGVSLSAPCLCRRGDPMINCHPPAFHGIRKLRSQISKDNM